MKVAIAVNHRSEVSPHFGRSPAFLVFQVEQGQILHREIRPNDQAGAQHGSGPEHRGTQAHPHDHNRFVQLLGDCQAVIGLGMGPGARQALESAGITVRLLEAPISPEEAAIGFETGLLPAGPRSCGGGHVHPHP
jgi:predicted Fe-Mo cluster-binding NifX family protein